MGLRRRARAVAWTLAILAVCGCSATSQQADQQAQQQAQPTASSRAAATSPASTGPASSAPAGGSSTGAGSSPAPVSSPPVGAATAPSWLGTRPLPRTGTGFGEVRRTPRVLRHRAFTLPDTVAALPGRGFASRTETAPADVIERSTWQAGCPVAAADLDWVRVTFRGFDGRRHTGELLVNASVTADVVSVFQRLWRAHFPIEQMQITTRAQLDAEPTGDGNDTESFVCRPTVGATTFSQHAYGLAIDVDPFQNPYVKADLVIPELSSSYLDRDDLRPGMITPDGPVVTAFAAVGWTWGGSWTSLKDLQHFSRNGR